MKHYNIKTGAFTLIELMIVLLIILILTMLSFYYYEPIKKKAYNLVALSDLRNLTIALELAYIDRAAYPEHLIDNISKAWVPSNAFVLDESLGFIPSKEVIVYYDSNGSESYLLATKHIMGDKIFIKSSSTSRMYSIYVELDNKSKDAPESIFPAIDLPEASPLLDDAYFSEHDKIYKSL